MLALLLSVFAVSIAHAEFSKLDPRARIALAHRRGGISTTLEASRAAGIALNEQGDLDVFITGDVSRGVLEAMGVKVRTALPGVMTAYIPVDVVDRVAALSGVTGIRGSVTCEPNLASSIPASGISGNRGAGPTFTGINGTGVLISDVDTGIDFSRTDFKTPGGLTRIINIWDQTVAVGSPPPPAPYTYGKEWTAANIDALTCTETDPSSGGGHGTHCMGIAAGDGSDTGGAIPAFTYAGVAPMADILEIKSGLQTTRIIDGVAYAFARATARGQNAVQNLSLGSQFGPHDGTSSFESALTAMTGPGRIICVSAGNDRANADSSRHGGWVISATDSAKFTIGGSGGQSTVTPGVNPTAAIDGYYNAGNSFNVTLRAPNGITVGPVTLGNSNAAYPGVAVPGAGTVYFENGIDTAPNGDPEIYFELASTSAANRTVGTWTMIFTPVVSVVSGSRVDMWQYFTNATTTRAWFTLKNTIDHLVSEPGNATGVITVAAWTTARTWTDCGNHSVTASFSIAGQVQAAPAVGNIAVFSSPGPTRDGRNKPDLAAPGLFIASTKSDDYANACPANPATLSGLINDGANHIINQGTSMAAPHVAGAAAMLMQKYGAMTPADIKTYLNAHATIDGFTGAPWNKDFGNGKLNLGDLINPVVTVIAPNGGESLARCTQTKLSWSATDNVGVTSVDIELSRSGPGGPFTTIALAQPNTGTYVWTVTGPLTANAYLKVTARDANANTASDLSDAAFSIVDGPAVIAAVSTSTTICPSNACVTLPVNITRNCGDPVLGFSVTIQLSPNLSLCNVTGSITEGTFLTSAGGTSFHVIDNGGGSYTVDDAVLGNDCGPTATTGNLFNVGVTSSDPSGTGSITVTTTLLRDCNNTPLPANPGTPGTVPIDNQAPTATLLSPNGGESWLIGTSQNITWTATDNVAVTSVDLAYSTDGGVTYPNVIATGIANSGSFVWSVPNTPTTLARVRVTAHDVCGAGLDASDANFTIRDPVIAASAGAGGSISPNGSVVVPYGTNQTFTITPDDKCHVVADVVVDGGSVGAVGSYTFLNVTVDHTIVASFTLLGPFTITASAGPGGSITPSGPVSVACGGSQTFAISAADKCHAILDVKVDGVSVGPVTSYTFTDVQANHTIDATFSGFGPFTITTTAGTGGSITPGGAVSVNCGDNQSFSIAAGACYHTLDVKVDGVSVGAVASYTFTDVQANHTLDATFAPNGLTTSAATGLAAAQVRNGNDGDGTTKITITYTTPAGAASVEVWRIGYGNYPLYDNPPTPGSPPSLPGSYPPAGWTLTTVSASGQTDEPTTRDFWYYVAYAKDACGNAAPVSNMTGGTLGYHLGDVSDGITPGQGDNQVSTADISLLGSHYGISGVALAPFSYLDVGPTTNNTVNARPTTDSRTDFEDLIIFALNYFPQASLAQTTLPVAARQDGISLEMTDVVDAGQVFDVLVRFAGTGTLQAVSTALKWDAAAVAPVSVSPGEFFAGREGAVFSPGPGRVDAAQLGIRNRGMQGDGVLAVVKFRALRAGAPGIAVDHVMGRDASNHPVTVEIMANQTVRTAVTTTALAPPNPNPSRGNSTLQYSLATGGPVELAIYSVDGRRVRTLVSGVQEVGRYQVSWNGADDHGTALRAGVFFVRLDAGGKRQSRVISLVR